MNNINDKIKIGIIIGSTRQGRFSDKPAYWLQQELEQWDTVEATIIDLRDHELPFFDEPVSPMRTNKQYNNPHVQQWANIIEAADAFIMITPEYNHGYTAVLKNALDHLYYEWNNKPVGFVSFGSVGGARVIEQMRQVVIELKMLPVKNAIHIPVPVYFAAMNLDATEAAPVFSKALRKDSWRDELGDFVNELVHLTTHTHSLRTPQTA